MMDVYMIEGDALMVGRPIGILDAQTAGRIVELVEIKEVETETGFSRFCDLSRLEAIHLSFAEVLTLAERRSLFNRTTSESNPHFWRLIRSRLVSHVCMKC